jgi:hypothetical protein
MRKLSVLMTVMLFAFSMNGQVNFGLQLGVNSSNVSYTIGKDFQGSDFDYPIKSKLGMNIGLILDYTINDQVGLQSGLMFTQKGYEVDWDQYLKENDMDGEIDGYWKHNYNYLELPLHFYYNANGVKIFAGPYFAYGLSGSSDLDLEYSYGGETQSVKDSYTINAVSGDVKSEEFVYNGDDFFDIKVFKALDLGFDFGVGYQYQQFFVKAQYSIGFNNLTPGISDYDEFDPNELKKTNKGFSFSVAYFFNKD